jgi:hypothetical protein
MSFIPRDGQSVSAEKRSEMSKKKTQRQQKPKVLQLRNRSRHKAVVIIGLILCLGLTSVILAQWRASHVAGMTTAMLASAAPLPQANQTPTLSKEYIYSGGRLIATEEPVTTSTPTPTPTPLPPGQESVIWTNMIGVTGPATNSTLTKSGAEGWNAGATSTRAIASGDGYVDFTADSYTARMCGLSNGDSNQSFTDIDFAIHPNPGHMIDIWEKGTFVSGGVVFYQPGDHFRVAVESNVVNYYKISGGATTLIYTSTQVPSYPLQVDTSLYYNNATISNVILSGNIQNLPPVPQNIVWTNAVGVTVTDNTLTKTGAEGWNAGAASTKAIASGDGYVEFTASAYNARMFGLSHSDPNQSFASIDYAIHPNPGHMIDIWEGGTFVSGGLYFYQPGDRFRVAIESQNSLKYVRYYRISGGTMTLLYEHQVSPTYPLMADTSLYYTGAEISDAVIFGQLTP